MGRRPLTVQASYPVRGPAGDPKRQKHANVRPSQLLGTREDDSAPTEDVPMPTPRECRQRARECLQLASVADEFYVRQALTELAGELQKMAEAGERTDDAD